MRWYCTYCDRNYLVRLLAMSNSLTRHEQSPFTLFIICLDELTRTILDHLRLPNITTIGLHELESVDEPLCEARKTRSLVEYYWTLTPTVLLYLFEQQPQIERLTYLDADLYFFSSPEPIFSEAPAASVLIHGHRFANRYKELEAFGTYNVGLLCFARNTEALSILNEWRDQCLTWCYFSIEDGKFGDQMYLNNWPQRFAGVHVLQHPGVGIAPWNQNDISLDFSVSGKLMVDGAPLIFYHFHALDILAPDVYAPARILHYCFDLPVLTCCYLPYVKILRQKISILQSILSQFECGISYKSGVVGHTLLTTLSTAQVLAKHITGFSCTNLEDGWVVGRLPEEVPDTTTADQAQ